MATKTKKRATKKRATKKRRRPRKAAAAKQVRVDESPGGLTAAVEKRIVDALEKGHFRNTAARMADIDPRTLKRWMHDSRGEGASAKLVRFAQRVERAEAKATDLGVKALTKLVSEGDGASVRFYLQKKDEEWGDKAKRALRGAVDAVVDVVKEELEPDVARRVCEAIARRLVAEGIS